MKIITPAELAQITKQAELDPGFVSLLNSAISIVATRYDSWLAGRTTSGFSMLSRHVFRAFINWSMMREEPLPSFTPETFEIFDSIASLDAYINKNRLQIEDFASESGWSLVIRTFDAEVNDDVELVLSSKDASKIQKQVLFEFFPERV